jgi:hypothetical protein
LIIKSTIWNTLQIHFLRWIKPNTNLLDNLTFLLLYNLSLYYEFHSNPHMRGGLWMKLHERYEYGINLIWRLTFIKIHLDLKSSKILHLDRELIGMNIHDGYDLNKSNKWHENFNQIWTKLNWKQFKIRSKSIIIVLSIINLLSFFFVYRKEIACVKPYTLPSFLIHPSIHLFIHAFIHSSTTTTTKAKEILPQLDTTY